MPVIPFYPLGCGCFSLALYTKQKLQLLDINILPPVIKLLFLLLLIWNWSCKFLWGTYTSLQKLMILQERFYSLCQIHLGNTVKKRSLLGVRAPKTSWLLRKWTLTSADFSPGWLMRVKKALSQSFILIHPRSIPSHSCIHSERPRAGKCDKYSCASTLTELPLFPNIILTVGFHYDY